MAVSFSVRADADLRHMYLEGVRLFGNARAEAYFAEIVSVCELLAAQPGLGPQRRGRSRSARVFPHRSHVILYRPTAGGVHILRVRHHRENWVRALI